MIKYGAWGHLATPPTTCRPTKRLIFNLNNHAATSRVDVLPDKIVWVAGGMNHRWMSLSGIVLQAPPAPAPAPAPCTCAHIEGVNKATSDEDVWHCKHYTGRGVMKL